jgi:hypothetical protein
MISKELDTVWITSDGKKFLYEKEAEAHEQNTKKEKLTWLERLHLK